MIIDDFTHNKLVLNLRHLEWALQAIICEEHSHAVELLFEQAVRDVEFWAPKASTKVDGD